MNCVLTCKDYCLRINADTATPVYYNDPKRKRSLLLFNVTCTLQGGVCVRSYDNASVKISDVMSSSGNKEAALRKNAVYYARTANTAEIEVAIPKTYFNKKIIIKFQLEISRNNNLTNDDDCALCCGSINKGKEMSKEDGDINITSDKTASPTCTANCSVIAYENENDYIVDNSSDYCMRCNKGNNRNVLLICDLCKYNVCHTYCDNLDSIPNEEWYCLECRHNKIKKCLNRKRTRALRLHNEIAF